MRDFREDKKRWSERKRERERNRERDRDREGDIGQNPGQSLIDRHTFSNLI